MTTFRKRHILVILICAAHHFGCFGQLLGKIIFSASVSVGHFSLYKCDFDMSLLGRLCILEHSRSLFCFVTLSVPIKIVMTLFFKIIRAMDTLYRRTGFNGDNIIIANVNLF